MRFTTIALLSLLFIIGCENPMELEPTNELGLYKGQAIEAGEAPFLINNSLAKKTDGFVVIGGNVAEGTLYGLQNGNTAYTAVGGEILPTGTWVGNQFDAPIEVQLSAGLVITFDELTPVTLFNAKKLIYINANGVEVKFSGDGTITTSAIYTKHTEATGLGKSASLDDTTTLISPVALAIGGDGGEQS